MTWAVDDRRLGLPQGSESEFERERILWSMVRAVAEEGYDATTVAGVAERAGVPTASFYDEFEDKDDCLLAAYDRVIDVLLSYVASEFESPAPWPVKIRLGLDALLRALAAEPEVARMVAIEVPAAGPDAHRRYRQAVERFLRFFAEGRDYAEGGDALPPNVEMMAVGGAEAIIFDEVVADRSPRLPEMLPEILFAVLVPFMGPDAASAEMRRATVSAT